MHEILLSSYVHIDSVARERGYPNGATLATFTLSLNPRRSADALAFIAWRDSVLDVAEDLVAHLNADPEHPWNACETTDISLQARSETLEVMRSYYLSNLPKIEWPRGPG
jgi:hypothetical protein